MKSDHWSEKISSSKKNYHSLYMQNNNEGGNNNEIATRLKKKTGNLNEQYRVKEKVVQRIKQIKRISSEHIVQILKAYDNGEVQYPYYQWHNLSQYLREHVDFSERSIFEMAKQFTKAMCAAETQQVHHLRIEPKAILIKKQTSFKPVSYFLKLGDFSLGKQYSNKIQLHQLSFSQYMHPELYFQDPQYFKQYRPRWDIWSFGVILYEMAYQKHPFSNLENKFDATKLHKYYKKQNQEMDYDLYPRNEKYRSLSQFIHQLLSLKQDPLFKTWADIKQYILNTKLFTDSDFQKEPFQEFYLRHAKSMNLFSCIYCLILEECEDSIHEFWQVPIAISQIQSNQTLHLFSSNRSIESEINPKYLAFGLIFLMSELNNQFLGYYSSHLFMLKAEDMDNVKNITNCIDQELKHISNQSPQLPTYFQPKTNQLKLKLKEICMNMSENIKAFQQSEHKIGPNHYINKISRSMEILYAFCKELLMVLNKSEDGVKRFQNNVYQSQKFKEIVETWF